MDLEINQRTTKYTYISQNDSNNSNLQVVSYLFEKVAST